MNGNSELGDIISRLTEDPGTMKKLMDIAGNLKQTVGDDGGTETAVHTEYNEIRPDKPKENRGDFSKRKSETENLIRLLIALKPYVNGERRSKIDNAVKLLKLLQLGEGAGLLKDFL